MRITDCRYDRDRLRLTVAYRLIAHEARTQTIRHCTGLSGDRIRKLYRHYMQGQAGPRVRRKRGKSPRQMSFFRRSVEHELQAATFGALLRCCGLLGRPQRLPGPRIEEVARFCDVYETFLCICPAPLITFEHAWYLGQVLAHRDEFVLARCPDCHALWVRDTLDILPDNCAACRAARLPDAAPEDC
ncbi:MAG: hypothetical protein FIB04_07675 [Gammaproteobacteria bacterium]|nr:hypothetical protein [Gammaproteobacteria bacterium]